MKKLIFMAALSMATSSTATAQTPVITAAPADAVIDVAVHIRVQGLKPSQQIIVESIVREDSANALVASGTYVGDGRGVVDITRDASTRGTYTGIEPMGLFWSSRRQAISGLKRANIPARAIAPPEPYTVAINVLSSDSVQLATTTVTRRFNPVDVQTVNVNEGDVVGQLFIPRGARRLPAVIVLGGSEGGFASAAYDARMLASHGYVAFAQAYFNAPGLQPELALVPVERISRGIDWLAKQKNINASRVALIASSRGTEIATIVANRDARVSKLILYGTSVTSGRGLTREGAPHRDVAWTMAGKPVPAWQTQSPASALEQFRKPDPVRLRLLTEPGLSDAASVERAALPVQNTRADVLIISGLDDQMGPSDIQGDMLIERLVRAGHTGRRIHLKYPEAGHVIGVPYTPAALRLRPWRFMYGGTVEGYGRADVDSWRKVLEFLR